MYEKIVTPRTQAVITPEQLASFGRFDIDDIEGVDYEQLQEFIEAATDEIENMAATACLHEQVLLTFDFFPGQADPRVMYELLNLSYVGNPWWWMGTFTSKDSIELVRRPVVPPSGSPVVNTVAVNYYDTNGVLQVLDPSVYTVFADKITLNVDHQWPLTSRRQDCIQITYTAGYSATNPTAVPARLRMAIKYLANHFYQIRQVVSVEDTSEIGLTLSRMLSSFRSFRIPR